MSESVERIVIKTLPVPLKEKELVKLGEDLAIIESTLNATKVAAKSSADTYKNKVAGLQDDFNEVLTKIRDKKEYREVSCLEVKDFNKKVVNYVYEGEILFSCALKPDDTQITMY